MSIGRILMLKIKSVCYDSTFQLADLYGKALEQLGYEVEYFSTAEEPITEMERYVGQHFDAVIDFNSLLPNLDTDEDTLFLDGIDGPFIDYILDHPLYHNKQLKSPLKNFHVICLDYDHEEYIRKYYPHIQSVSTLPLFALPVAQADAKRDIDVLFTGTYTPANDMLHKINSFDKPFSDEMKMLIDILLENPSLTQEEAVLKLAKDLGFDEASIMMRDRLYTFFLVDMYIKSYYREKLVESVLQDGRTLTVYGGQWEFYESPNAKYLDVHDMIPFHKTPELMQHANICLNIMPWFKAGIHDRVFTAMHAGAAMVTDTSQMLEEEFVHKQDILVYDLQHMEQVPELIAYGLEDKARLQELAKQGQKKVAERHSLEVRAKQLSDVIQNIKTQQN